MIKRIHVKNLLRAAMVALGMPIMAINKGGFEIGDLTLGAINAAQREESQVVPTTTSWTDYAASSVEDEDNTSIAPLSEREQVAAPEGEPPLLPQDNQDNFSNDESDSEAEFAGEAVAPAIDSGESTASEQAQGEAKSEAGFSYVVTNAHNLTQELKQKLLKEDQVVDVQALVDELQKAVEKIALLEADKEAVTQARETAVLQAASREAQQQQQMSVMVAELAGQHEIIKQIEKQLRTLYPNLPKDCVSGLVALAIAKEEKEASAATKIQVAVRGMLAKKEAGKLKEAQQKAIEAEEQRIIEDFKRSNPQIYAKGLEAVKAEQAQMKAAEVQAKRQEEASEARELQAMANEEQAQRKAAEAAAQEALRQKIGGKVIDGLGGELKVELEGGLDSKIQKVVALFKKNKEEIDALKQEAAKLKQEKNQERWARLVKGIEQKQKNSGLFESIKELSQEHKAEIVNLESQKTAEIAKLEAENAEKITNLEQQLQQAKDAQLGNRVRAAANSVSKMFSETILPALTGAARGFGKVIISIHNSLKNNPSSPTEQVAEAEMSSETERLVGSFSTTSEPRSGRASQLDLLGGDEASQVEIESEKGQEEEV